MACSPEAAPPTVQTVTISYSELKDKNADLSMKIEEGFGPNSLGILSITDVPGYTSLRQNLLHLSPRLAKLPEEVKKELEDPHSRYNFGWSHGKEKLESGKPDILKGSFYANPILDIPTTEASLIQRYPSYCGTNIWPDNALPELEVVIVPKTVIPCRLGADGIQIMVPSQVVFGEDEIAYQIGETTEILSRGFLCATPHCVRAPKGEKASGLERSTFAFFMQPDWDEKLNFPQDVHIHKELILSNGSLTFGEYSEKLLDKYYHMKT
ncbi:hypothetical protein L1049_000944 [Liquidambar formosana]|uniref:Non-haem dioxygenase N-terminal domain-containing protein n=1 Tax=Liquidambar formosana TaxID=63359 RepID=A0AAP0R560_LIQFO